MQRFLTDLDKYLKYYFLISILAISAVIFFLAGRLYRVEVYLGNLKNQTLVEQIDKCGSDCQRQIDEAVTRAVATVSGAPVAKTVVKENLVGLAPSEGNTKTTYIPLIGSYSSLKNDWADVPGTDVYIDLANDYKTKTWVSWEAFISADNGQVLARLYDATHNIAVSGSELTTDAKILILKISGNLNFWAGRNLYRVQIKSINGINVTFGGGRIKINY